MVEVSTENMTQSYGKNGTFYNHGPGIVGSTLSNGHIGNISAEEITRSSGDNDGTLKKVDTSHKHNLFQYAFLRGLSSMTNHTPILPPQFNFLKDIFYNLSIPIVSQKEYDQYRFVTYKERWGLSLFNETMQNITMMSKTTSHIRITGFFQSYLYFEKVRSIIHRDFNFNQHIRNNVSAFFNRNLPMTSRNSTVTTVGVHVRLTDMEEGRFGKELGWILPPKSYFEKAMDYFRTRYDDVYFIVCSDDKKWVKTNLISNNISQVIFSHENSYVIDFAILATCDHVIISRGTFGWWAGFLTKGITIYYKNYYPPNSNASRYIPEWSYIPRGDVNNHWISLDV
jgi:galactoside 2-L-fucosyltransferase 1/2